MPLEGTPPACDRSPAVGGRKTGITRLVLRAPRFAEALAHRGALELQEDTHGGVSESDYPTHVRTKGVARRTLMPQGVPCELSGCGLPATSMRRFARQPVLGVPGLTWNLVALTLEPVSTSSPGRP